MVLLSTDNVVVEQAIYKGGNSVSRFLFNLVLILKGVKLTFGCEILVTHVARSRMISQGMNGISCGYLKSGVSLG